MTHCTVVVSTYKRSLDLDRCLQSVMALHAKIIVVNNASDEGTAKVAKKYNAMHIERENNLMLNVNKNYGFSQATSEWILNLDDDEELTPELVASILKVLAENNQAINGYWMPRKNIIFGKWIRHGVWWPDTQLRLFRRGKGKFDQIHVHEYIKVEGKTETLDAPFLHYNYDSIEQFLYKMERIYTPSEVLRLEKSGYKVVWYDAIRFPISDFVKLFFLERGYKDGLHGLVLSILQAFYMFIVFVKLWEKDGFKEKELSLGLVSRELQERGKEITYWVHTSNIHETSNPLLRLWYQMKRKIARINPL